MLRGEAHCHEQVLLLRIRGETFFLKTDNFFGKSDSRNAKMTVQIFCKNDSINVFQKSRYKFAAHIYLLYVLYLSKSSPTLFKDVFRISFGFKRWKEANLAL